MKSRSRGAYYLEAVRLGLEVVDDARGHDAEVEEHPVHPDHDGDEDGEDGEELDPAELGHLRDGPHIGGKPFGMKGRDASSTV